MSARRCAGPVQHADAELAQAIAGCLAVARVPTCAARFARYLLALCVRSCVARVADAARGPDCGRATSYSALGRSNAGEQRPIAMSAVREPADLNAGRRFRAVGYRSMPFRTAQQWSVRALQKRLQVGRVRTSARFPRVRGRLGRGNVLSFSEARRSEPGTHPSAVVVACHHG